MPNLVDLTGKRFGRLIPIKRVENGHFGRVRWLCQCDCGRQSVVYKYRLSEGKTRSCGCLYRETAGARTRTHGLSKTKVYRTWQNMKKRCLNPTRPKWRRDYFDRGIRIHPDWIRSFEAFYRHVGDPPTPKHSLDRINNHGNYEPGNVRWATGREQRLNSRTHVTEEA
jgi:hypothetical protein